MPAEVRSDTRHILAELGGDQGFGIAVNTAGNVYVIGTTTSSDFPTVSAIQPTKSGIDNAFVTEINSNGTGLAYSTYLGAPQYNSGYGVAVDAANSAYVAGNTMSRYFPKTLLALQRELKGNPNIFVTKIAAQTFVSLFPTKQFFPTTLLGTRSVTKTVLASNHGSGTLTINKIYIGGLDPSDFVETNTCGSALAAGASCTISVTFTPTDKNLRSAVLGISDSDPGSPQAAPLGGMGTVVSLSKTKLPFGDEAVGATSASQTVTLTNVGSARLNFTGITITGTNPTDFSQTDTCGTSIAAKASCTITVKFKPTATGTRNALLSISDDGGPSPQRVSLTGTGT
jgi:centrosomal CEP192-like protein/beta-propeller repeat-containing protein